MKWIKLTAEDNDSKTRLKAIRVNFDHVVKYEPAKIPGSLLWIGKQCIYTIETPEQIDRIIQPYKVN